MAITHAKISNIPDGPDSDLILPSDWNAEHIGGGSDPQELVHYLSVGASPDSPVDGNIYLAEGFGLWSHSADYSGGTGEAEGEQSLISLQTYDSGFGLFSALKIGSATGPMGYEMIFDGYWNSALVLPKSARVYLSAAPDYSNPTAITNFENLKLGTGEVTLMSSIPAEGESRLPGSFAMAGKYFPTDGAVTTALSAWQLNNLDPETGIFDSIWYADNASVALSSDGALYPNSPVSLGEAGNAWDRVFASLPTTDPDVKDELWAVDDAGLAAALGAGARYVMMSKHA